MDITDVRIKKLDSDGKTKAFASITFDDSFVVKGLKIVEGKNGLFISMPSRKRSNGDYVDIAHPVKAEVRAKIQERILNAYEKLA
ncbi:septation regulator SpoVG [Selenihalanaerobacter shriftii]|uniref:Stage V sporulation protein G n=1 Tax=Selenihalanaerobacter shriftii TaxID=142842 RepID=A0A1T4N577_9FIRM|nr:septation regulator SpoVG [Selenihalanaerobacter shriftii]SJZ74403.1 stage V sporulation protein G [Selenihalanaerobacter shriftii]